MGKNVAKLLCALECHRALRLSISLLFKKKIYFFIVRCVGSLLLCTSYSTVALLKLLIAVACLAAEYGL